MVWWSVFIQSSTHTPSPETLLVYESIEEKTEAVNTCLSRLESNPDRVRWRVESGSDGTSRDSINNTRLHQAETVLLCQRGQPDSP